MAALLLSTGAILYMRYIETDRNHADGPSRGYHIGVAPKKNMIPPRSKVLWRVLALEEDCIDTLSSV
jgi:hypothetical protein